MLGIPLTFSCLQHRQQISKFHCPPSVSQYSQPPHPTICWSILCPPGLCPPRSRPGVTFGLLVCLFLLCGLALLGLGAFASWKLCWVPWRNKALSSSSAALSPACGPDSCPLQHHNLPSPPSPASPHPVSCFTSHRLLPPLVSAPASPHAPPVSLLPLSLFSFLSPSATPSFLSLYADRKSTRLNSSH